MRDKKTILILVLILVIGFASVSTTLVLNGVIGISSKTSDFNVIFTSATLDGIEKKEFIDDTTKKTIKYETKVLTDINETTTLNYEVTNTSRFYDAEVSVSCIPTNNEYIKIENIPNSLTVHAGETETGSITTKLTKVSTEDQNIDITCTLNARATERESIGNEYIPPHVVTFNTNGGEAINTNKEVNNGGTYGELPTPIKGNFEFLGWYTEDREKVDSTTLVKNEDHTLIAGWRNPNLTGYEISYDADLDGIDDIGDKITVGTESFYVISHTDRELNALAKYNLKVGNIFNSDGTLERTITSSEEGYGIQNAQMKGWEYEKKAYGTVAFSNSNGWQNANNATINIKDYDGPIKTALYGDNGYENYIKQTITTAKVRLITLSELEGLGCVRDGNTCGLAPSWVYSSTYWIGSSNANDGSLVWRVDSNTYLGETYYYYFDFLCGVRPVITIPKA